MKKLIYSSLALAFAGAMTINANAQLAFGEDCGCPDVSTRPSVDLSTLTDANGNIADGTVLSCDNVYRIDEKVYVNDGDQLFVEAGTVLKGVFGAAADANALIVARGGQIFANGTDCCPIIFTADADPLDGTYPLNTAGQWGGVIMLGNATTNLTAAANGGGLSTGVDGEGFIEGLLQNDDRNKYGATAAAPGVFNDADNSGVLRYVSIRHGGTDIGEGNEINGLTCGGVGSGTVLDHIEVVSNGDDGIEFFGGTVNLKYATVLFCKDDYIDWDHGYTGKCQFLFGVQSPQSNTNGDLMGDNGFEADSDDNNGGTAPVSNPTIYNATIIGNGSDVGLELKEGTAGTIVNSIFANFSTGAQFQDENAGRPDAYDNYLGGSLDVSSNCFAGVGTFVTPVDGTLDTQFGGENAIDDTVIDYTFTVDLTNNSVTDSYNAVPAAGSASSSVASPVDGWFCGAQYKGAFKPGAEPWTAGWTVGEVLGADLGLVDTCPEDINEDGEIDVTDFIQFAPKFGTSCPSVQ